MHSRVAALESARSRQLVDDIRSIVGTDLDLPQIAVIGDTSAGKSSVLSAISGVVFPSSDELCTRCPIQLRLSRAAGPERARVSLARCETRRSIPVPTPQELSSMGPELTLAIETFMAASVQGCDEGIVSEDIVIVEASGANLPDLSLVDLPGLVRTTTARGTVEEKVISSIRAMLLRHVQQPRTVILAVVAANVALENQEVLKLARDADKDGMRTLPILTKVDIIERGTEQSIVALLRNQRYQMTLGWSAIICLDKLARDEKKTIEDGRCMEELVWQKEPWRSCGAAALGASRLAGVLVDLLHERIKDQLPSVLNELETKLRDTEAELALMGPEFDSPHTRRLEFESRLSKVVTLVSAAARSYSPDSFFDNLSHRSRALVAQHITEFAQAIRVACRFPTSEKLQKGDRAVRLVPTKVPSVKSTSGLSVRRQSAVLPLDAKSNVGKQPLLEDRKQTILEDRPEVPSEWLPGWVVDVEQQLLYTRGEELPGFLSFRGFCSLFASLVLSKWRAPMEKMVESVLHAMEAVVEAAVSHNLSRDSSMYNFFVSSTKEVIASEKEKFTAALQALLEHEREPTTKNHYYYDTLIKLRLQPLEQKLTDAAEDDDGTKVLKLDVVLAILQKTSSLSNEEHEVAEMSCVLKAYSKVAAKRFIDNVEQAVTHNFVNLLGSRISAELLSKADDQMLLLLMEESRSAQLKRRQVKTELDRLREAQQRVKQYRLGGQLLSRSASANPSPLATSVSFGMV